MVPGVVVLGPNEHLGRHDASITACGVAQLVKNRLGSDAISGGGQLVHFRLALLSDQQHEHKDRQHDGRVHQT